MSSRAKLAVFAATGAVLAFGFGPIAMAGSHTWDVWEIFSNADGTVQFIELRETNNTSGEVGLGGHLMIPHPSGVSFTITHSVASPTNLRSFLLGTAAYAALPGAPAPDDIIPANFIKFATDSSVEYNPWDTATWTAGTLPTNGIGSLQRPGTGLALAVNAANSPRNYAGVTGSVDASGGGSLPGVPDGTTGTGIRVAKNAADGSSLGISWDASTCSDTNNHQILFGDRSGFPTVPGGNYTLTGGACGIGTTSPFTWTPTPSSTEGSGLLWFLVVTKSASGTEGPWGTYNGTAERNGPGTGGASNVCTTASKSVAATCGH